jgi:hypothetical protein
MLTDADQKLDLFKWLIVRKPASREELIFGTQKKQ